MRSCAPSVGRSRRGPGQADFGAGRLRHDAGAPRCPAPSPSRPISSSRRRRAARRSARQRRAARAASERRARRIEPLRARRPRAARRTASPSVNTRPGHAHAVPAGRVVEQQAVGVARAGQAEAHREHRADDHPRQQADAQSAASAASRRRRAAPSSASSRISPPGKNTSSFLEWTCSRAPRGDTAPHAVLRGGRQQRGRARRSSSRLP